MIRTLLILVSLYSNFISAQVEIIREPVEIISNRSVYLNSGMKSIVGGGNSRSIIKVDLPPNTVTWYYSFTTSKNKQSLLSLNLESQLLNLTINNRLETEDDSSIDVPTGICGVDIYILDQDNVNPFLSKVDLNGGTYSYHIDGTVQNTKQAVVRIDKVKENSIYLGLRNPGTFIGANVMIEVVAITETRIEIKKPNDQLKAELLGYLAKDELNSKNYNQCIVYCDESIKMFPLGWVKVTKGLAQLHLCYEEEAVKIFFDAILLINEEPNARKIFSELLIELKKIEKEKPDLVEVSKIRKMIELQLD